MAEVRETGAPGEPDVRASGAGAMLRAARQDQGLHIGALAAAIKVPQAKLEALEGDRYQDLPDATFTRALAQTVCRVLKIDPEPVLARLPTNSPAPLERVDGGLNMPFRDRPGRIDPTEWAIWRRPSFWIVAVLLGAAVVVAVIPPSWVAGVSKLAGRAPDATGSTGSVGSSALPAAVPASALAGAIVERADVMPPRASAGGESDRTIAAVSAAASGTEGVAGAAAAPVPIQGSTRLRATEATWVRVTDSRGQILLSRVLSPGEVVDFDAEPPLALRIGNAQGTQVWRHGQPVDLTAATRDNVASLELR